MKPNRNRALSLEEDVVFRQHNRKCLLVRRLQKPMPELVVYVKEDPDETLSKLFVFQSAFIGVNPRNGSYRPHRPFPSARARIASRVGPPLCTSSTITDCGPSATSAVNSSPRIIGPG